MRSVRKDKKTNNGLMVFFFKLKQYWKIRNRNEMTVYKVLHNLHCIHHIQIRITIFSYPKTKIIIMNIIIALHVKPFINV